MHKNIQHVKYAICFYKNQISIMLCFSRKQDKRAFKHQFINDNAFLHCILPN